MDDVDSKRNSNDHKDSASPIADAGGSNCSGAPKSPDAACPQTDGSAISASIPLALVSISSSPAETSKLDSSSSSSITKHDSEEKKSFAAQAMQLESEGNFMAAVDYWRRSVECKDDPSGLAECRLAERMWMGYNVSHDKQQAKQLYVRSARKGCPLGRASCLYLGAAPYSRNLLKAFGLFSQVSAQSSDTDAMNNAGWRLRDGEGVSSDVVGAVALFRQSAERGHADGWYSMGNCYLTGRGVEKNMSEAVKCYRMAADQNHLFAIERLLWRLSEANLRQRNLDAFASLSATVVEELYARACAVSPAGEAALEVSRALFDLLPPTTSVIKEVLHWLNRAVNESKNADAKALFERYFSKESGVYVSGDLDGKWFEVAVHLNEPELINRLGRAYEHGFAVIQDHNKAVDYYRRAAKLGSSTAVWNLALCYLEGKGVARNSRQARKWIRRAAHGRTPEAMFEMGCMYRDGTLGRWRNAYKAFKWFKKAADARLPAGLNEVGYFYEIGIAVTINRKLAAQYYQQAADLGSAVGQWNLALCYLNGCGVDVHLPTAILWLERAAAQKHRRQWALQALCKLAECYFVGSSEVAINDKKAIDCLVQAAECGSARACNAIANLYAKGVIVPREPEERMKWRELACSYSD